MSAYSSWRAKQTGNPWMLVISIGFLTIGGWMAHKVYYAPWIKRKRLREAEEYAKVLLKDE